MIFCASCSHPLTGELTPVATGFEPNWDGWELQEELVPSGSYWPTNEQFWLADGSGHARTLVINSEDQTGLEPNTNNYGGGCCGNSLHVLNQLCAGCQVPIGIHIDDCYTGVYIYFHDTQIVTRQERELLSE